MVGYDIDGTLTTYAGIPANCDCVISGRTFGEYDGYCAWLAQQKPVYIRGAGKLGDAQAAGEFKVMMIKHLGVTEFHEDCPTQSRIIAEKCPDVTLVLYGVAKAEKSNNG